MKNCWVCQGTGKTRFPIRYYCGKTGRILGTRPEAADRHARSSCDCIIRYEYGQCPVCQGTGRM